MNNILTQFPEAELSASNPFCTGSFHRVLEQSSCATTEQGWRPVHFQDNGSLLPSYIKSHSYGEYIFDWGWAKFYERNSIPYYPKLIHAIPFTPVNAPKFLNATEEQTRNLAKMSFDLYQSNPLSSEHYLFINEKEFTPLESLGFEKLKTLQYHFENIWLNFDHFLESLKKNRRKMIKKERRKIAESGLRIEKLTGSKITPELLKEFYGFYLTTIDKKLSYAYLSEEFFIQLALSMQENILITAAYEDDRIIAMAIFFYGEDALYGRNWGILPEKQNTYSGLHFELCYYQGMDFCFENKIKLFEAGAQGEHKLWRGFKPVQILSAHHIKIPECFDIIKRDIHAQNLDIANKIVAHNEYLPYRISKC